MSLRVLAFASFGVLATISLCSHQRARSESAGATSVAAIALKPMRDSSRSARLRWRDIADRDYLEFLRGQPKFSYAAAAVALSYEMNPAAPYFMGHITATGLKPNFWYQMKLAGKPVSGKRGWGSAGDDWTNLQLGRAGRWWCEDEGKNVDNLHYYLHYQRAAKKHTVSGYLYFGGFLTDENGSADVGVNGNRSYHVTWRSGQKGINDVVAGTWQLSSTSGYGYGRAFGATQPVTLSYEYEANGRSGARGVQLPPGAYRCRFLLTEETFHSTDRTRGGLWQNVMANEDFSYNAAGSPVPDTSPQNDIVFTIGPTRSGEKESAP